MAETLYKDTTYQVSMLVESIRMGKIALPDIQRPFVWQAAKVRALFDSMYQGFPVGYLLFWETGAGAGTRQIGQGDDAVVANHLIVDGQQRLTSLFAVMTGTAVLREDYSRSLIRIAFRPADATFAVTDAAIEKDPEFIPDISVLWGSGGQRSTTRAYLKGIRARRVVDEDEADRLADAIDRLYDLQHYPFKVVELSSSVDEERVAEIFVRINSEGVTLNQADFILTLMSVFWEKGRRDLEDFCRASRAPSVAGDSPFNWYLQPQPAQLLRTSIAVAFRRSALKHVYTILRGRELETGKATAQRREEQFARLATAQEQVLNITNWHEFLLCLERAGFRGEKMISSKNAIIFTYAMWLIGRVDHRVPLDRLREVIARWFFMAHTTGRYTGSFETQVERDLGQLPGAAGAPEEFVAVLSGIIDDNFTTDYWQITLPNQLDSSGSTSPALMAYLAALNILDADALLSTVSVRVHLDPAVTRRKGIERHHLFPRAHLRGAGVKDTKVINQIANMSLVEWHDNIAIADKPPSVYWPEQLARKGIDDQRLAAQARWHALPEGWTDLAYPEFLARRRKLMATVVRDAFARLANPAYTAKYPEPSTADIGVRPSRGAYGVRILDLIDAGLVTAGTVLSNPTDEAEAVVHANGGIEFDGVVHDSPSAAAGAAHGGAANGWQYWYADGPGGFRALAALRDEVLGVA